MKKTANRRVRLAVFSFLKHLSQDELHKASLFWFKNFYRK